MSISTRTKGENSLQEIKVTSDLASEPVTLDELKNHLRVDNTVDDDLITALGISARRQLEEWAGLSFGVKTIEVIYRQHSTQIILPSGPHDSITSVTLIDYQNTETALVADEGYFVKGQDYKEIWLNCIGEGLKVVFTTKAPIASDLELAKTAIKQAVSTMYEFREDTLAGTIISPVHVTSRAICNSISRNTVALMGF